MNYPKITIVTTNLNGGRFIENAILSIINQQYPNLEYIVIDGGSSDNSIDIIKKYEKYLKFWVSEKDLGLYYAIQKGFEKSSGEIMGWLNSDDMHHAYSLFSIADIFTQHSYIEWLTGNPTFFDEKGRTVHCWGVQRLNKYDLAIYPNKWLQQESTFWRRSLWSKADSQLNTIYLLAADYELWTRFSLYADLFVTDTLLAGFRFRSSNQLTLDKGEQYIDEVKNIILNNPIRHSASFKFYSVLMRINRWLSIIKIINTRYLDLAIRHVFKVKNRIIVMDRSSQKYI